MLWLSYSVVITKTPFRISFFGGGTDYPAWFDGNGGGAVLSTTINKYCYITCRYLPPFFNHRYRIRYSENELTQTIDQIQHPSVKACLTYAPLQGGVEIQHNSDLPAMSGLGSSSSFTVGLLNALNTLRGTAISSKMQLARDAIHVEQNIIKENVGSQDQVAAAFGGFNRIEFGGYPSIKISLASAEPQMVRALEDRCMLFFTGFSRIASEIAGEQVKTVKQKENELHQMKAMVDDAMKILHGPIENINDFGRLLHESWQIKRGLSSKITNEHIDGMYADAREAGALGGKILGAGGGGFMLIFADPAVQPKIKEKLGKFLYVPFRFEEGGSQVIFNNEDATTTYFS